METFDEFKRRHKVPVMKAMILKNFVDQERDPVDIEIYE